MNHARSDCGDGTAVSLQAHRPDQGRRVLDRARHGRCQQDSCVMRVRAPLMRRTSPGTRIAEGGGGGVPVGSAAGGGLVGGHHRDRGFRRPAQSMYRPDRGGIMLTGLLPGRSGGSPRRSPLRTVRATHRGTRLMQAPRGDSGELCCAPALADEVSATAGGVYESGSIITRSRPWSPVMNEVIRRDRLTSDPQPPSFPLFRRLGRLFGEEEVVAAQRTARFLLGEQAERVLVERRLDLLAPSCPIVR